MRYYDTGVSVWLLRLHGQVRQLNARIDSVIPYMASDHILLPRSQVTWIIQHSILLDGFYVT